MVGLAAIEVTQERLLGRCSGLLVDGAVVDIPVHRQAESAEDLLERLLVLDGQRVAQFDKVGAADRKLV